MRQLEGFITAILFLIFAMPAFSQDNTVCGDPPSLSDEILKGEIKGQAEALTKYIGQAELAGQFEKSRREIFSRYPDAEKTRSNAYFEYVFCEIIMSDKSLTTEKKLQLWKDMHRERNSAPKKSLVTNQAGERSVAKNPEKLTTAAEKPANERVYTIRIVPDLHLYLGLYDNRLMHTKMEHSSSKFMLYVDGYLVETQWLNDKPFTGITLTLQAGMHKFGILGDVMMSEDGTPPLYRAQDTCLSDFNVVGDETFYPLVELSSWNGFILKIPTCQLIAKVTEQK